jgi:hypothetical protein
VSEAHGPLSLLLDAIGQLRTLLQQSISSL